MTIEQIYNACENLNHVSTITVYIVGSGEEPKTYVSATLPDDMWGWVVDGFKITHGHNVIFYV